jgi:hypothetical protein
MNIQLLYNYGSNHYLIQLNFEGNVLNLSKSEKNNCQKTGSLLTS